MDYFHSWTAKVHQISTTPSPTQFIESPHTQINICTGIVTTSSQLNSVFNTLAHRAKIGSTTQQTLQKELEHIRRVLQACHFQPGTLHKLQHQFECKHNINNGPSSRDNQLNNNNSNSETNNSNNNKNIFIVVTYIQELVERCKRTCNNKAMWVHFKGTNIIKPYL